MDWWRIANLAGCACFEREKMGVQGCKHDRVGRKPRLQKSAPGDRCEEGARKELGLATRRRCGFRATGRIHRGVVILLRLSSIVLLLKAGDGLRDDRGALIDEARVGAVYDETCGASLVDKGLGQDESAIRGLAAALVLQPNVTVAWFELALIWGSGGSGLFKDALSADRCLATAHRLDPGYREAVDKRHEMRAGGGVLPSSKPYVDLGDEAVGPGMSQEERNAKIHQSRYKRRLFEKYYTMDTSVKRHQQMLKIRPDDFDVLIAIAKLYTELQEHDKAAQYYRRASNIKQDDGEVFVRLVEAQIKGCVFADWDDNFARLSSIVVEQARRGREPSLSPIPSTVYPLRPYVSLAICSFLGQRDQDAVDKSPLSRLPISFAPPKKAKMTIAYMTSHFTSSSIGREMLFIIGSHDTARYNVHCYALNSDEGSWLQHTWRVAITKACHKFVDVSGMSDRQIAERINRDGVTALMDLNGWSGGMRTGVIAERPAPVQVNYKNWVASAGMPNLHYIVGDAVATPPEFQSDFTEGMVLVPNSYFISGHKYQYPLSNEIQEAAEAGGFARSKQRAAHRLPAQGFLMGNFNNLDKLEPNLWRMWKRIVDRMPSVILWLQQYPPAKAARVEKLAQEEGGALAHRLIITPFFKSDHHISIKALADVFVDNPAYNAHSTAMDTLWGGLPLATLPQEKFSARVGASLLMALGSGGETIARDMSDLEDIVTALVARQGPSRQIRKRLEQARATHPLYDTVRAVRNLEVALRCMFEASRQGDDRPSGKNMHIATSDVGKGGDYEPELEKKLHGMRVDTSHAEVV